MFTSMALSLFKTLDSIATPCSVNANGKYFGYFPLPLSKVLKLHLEFHNPILMTQL